MPVKTIVRAHNLALDETLLQRIVENLKVLDQRLEPWADAVVVLVLTGDPIEHQVEAELRIEAALQRDHLVSYQRAQTPEQAVRQAVMEADRTLEWRLASSWSEPRFALASGGVR